MSITAMRADRIEKTLAADPATSRVLGPKTHTICTFKGDRKYCAEVIAVAQAIDEAGEDASKLTIRQIRNFAMPILMAKAQGKPLPPIRPEFLAPAVAEAAQPAKAKKPAPAKKKEPLLPKSDAADAVAPRRKKPEPKAEAAAKAKPPKAEPKPEPEPESLEGEAEPMVPPARPIRQPESKPDKLEPKAKVIESAEESSRTKLPYVVGVAVSTLLISAINLLEQYDKKDVEAYRLIDKAITDITKITHIPNPCAKEVPPTAHRNDAS
jgi:outer membrane biosynthesis protein TonB